jgi:hypothetical protein
MKRIVPLVVGAALALTLAACSSVTPEASITPQVTFGQPDIDDDYAHVVTLLFVQNGMGYYSCTGTLLSPTVVLTAGHCVEGGGEKNEVTYVRNTRDALAGFANYGSTQDWLDAEWVLADDVIPHPDYADYADFPFTYDVGLVILPDTGAFDGLSTYGELAQEGLLDDVKGGKPKDRQFTVVGYGMQGVVPAFYSDEYERYYGTTTLINVNSAYTGDGMTAVFTNNPGKGNGEGGSCYGDSGGPLFYKDTNQIAAIVSFGITPCIGPDFQFRMDTEAAQDFVFGERPELE